MFVLLESFSLLCDTPKEFFYLLTDFVQTVKYNSELFSFTSSLLECFLEAITRADEKVQKEKNTLPLLEHLHRASSSKDLTPEGVVLTGAPLLASEKLMLDVILQPSGMSSEQITPEPSSVKEAHSFENQPVVMVNLTDSDEEIADFPLETFITPPENQRATMPLPLNAPKKRLIESRKNFNAFWNQVVVQTKPNLNMTTDQLDRSYIQRTISFEKPKSSRKTRLFTSTVIETPSVEQPSQSSSPMKMKMTQTKKTDRLLTPYEKKEMVVVMSETKMMSRYEFLSSWIQFFQYIKDEELFTTSLTAETRARIVVLFDYFKRLQQK